MRIATQSLPTILAVVALSIATPHVSYGGERPRLHLSSQTPAAFRAVESRANRAEAALAEAEAQADRARRLRDAAQSALREAEARAEDQAADAASAAQHSWMETPEADMLTDYGEMVNSWKERAATSKEKAERLRGQAQTLQRDSREARSAAEVAIQYTQEVGRWSAAWRTDSEFMHEWSDEIRGWSDHPKHHMPFGRPADRSRHCTASLSFHDNSHYHSSWLSVLPGRLGHTREARRRLLDLVAPSKSEDALAAEDAIVEAQENIVRRQCGRREDCRRDVRKWLEALDEATVVWQSAAMAAAAFTRTLQQRAAEAESRAVDAASEAEAASKIAEVLAHVVDAQATGSALERARAATRILTEELGTESEVIATAREIEQALEERHGSHLAAAEASVQEAMQHTRANHEGELRALTAAAEDASRAAAPLIAAERAARTSYEEAAALLEAYEIRRASWSAAKVAAEEWSSARTDANRAALVGASLHLGTAMIAAGAASRKLTEAGETMIGAAGRIPHMNKGELASATAALEVWTSRTTALRKATLRAGRTAAASVVGLASTGDLLLDGMDLGEALLAADRAADTLLAALAAIS